MKKLILLCIIGLSTIMVAPAEGVAATQEKGEKKCSDGIDNDGDMLIDSADPDCGAGDDGGTDCPVGGLFPALLYPVDSATGDGTRDLVVASGDGCTESTVEESIQLGGVRLKYDETTGSGIYAWSENVFPGNPPGTIRRQDFTATGNSLMPTTSDDLYVGVGYLGSFDLQGNLLVVVDRPVEFDEPALLVIDLSTCDGGLPCNGSDAVAVYTPSVDCLQDPAIVGCFRPSGGLTMSLDGTEIYFNVQGDDPNGGRVYGIARVVKNGGWAAQTPELFLRGDNYYEARAYGLSQDKSYLAIGYLAGFQNGGLRDDRVIILDTIAKCDGNPCEATGLSQDFPAWTATWTINDTFYVLGTEGKRRKLKHPIEEFDPATGQRDPLGISLNDHPGIDSSL